MLVTTVIGQTESGSSQGMVPPFGGARPSGLIPRGLLLWILRGAGLLGSKRTHARVVVMAPLAISPEALILAIPLNA